MQAVKLETIPGGFNLSVDERFFDKAFMLKLFQRLQLEYLAKKVNFDEGIVELGEEIKATWWAENKHRWIKPEDE